MKYETVSRGSNCDLTVKVESQLRDSFGAGVLLVKRFRFNQEKVFIFIESGFSFLDKRPP